MEESNQKDISVWSIFLNTLGFIFGAFLIFKLIRGKDEKEKKEKDIIPPKAVKDEVKKMRNIKNKVFPVNERQYKILATIREKKEMEPSEIYALDPSVSTRTLRRDMDVLVSKGVVRQEGSTKSTKYTYLG